MKATLEGAVDVQGILGIDPEVRNGFSDVKVHFDAHDRPPNSARPGSGSN